MSGDEWAIYATRQPDYGYEEPDEEVIATFDSKESAEEYIEKSKLKRPTWRRIFKYKSLLYGYRHANVQIYIVEHPQHEPQVNWK